MKREFRLPQTKLGGEIANTAFTATEGFKHPQAQWIGERLEQLARLLSLKRGWLACQLKRRTHHAHGISLGQWISSSCWITARAPCLALV